ncbi:hypothetical protein DSM112329_05193 [Paraconexibacter sp. AEG42_29]|uniref:DUF4367 domain-containing protein n=1 Tax=Paraconexibacter sp. AEG42_29 TaxID=2997339 RepID=A0AAU7B348_9ACTN
MADHDPDDTTPLTDEEQALADRGAALIAAAVADPRTLAPHSLREAIERDRAKAVPARRAGWFGVARARVLAGGGVLAAAVIALVLALGGSGDGPGGPTAVQVASIGRLPATGPAPAAAPPPGPAQKASLDAEVEGLPFPDWEGKFRWVATGQRSDEAAGRSVRTVFYRNEKGATLGYSIVAGEPIGGAPAGRDVRSGPGTYRVAKADGRTTVTWTQDGHTCVIDAPSTVPDAKLVELASWANA